MLAKARKNCAAFGNIAFEQADITALDYPDDSFDAVLIANALHVMPEPEKALREIDRVLRPGGILIAPNFVEHQAGIASRLWSEILSLAGVRFEHQWTSQEYLAWLEEHDWRVTFSKEMAARITLMYAECGRKEDKT
jgi:ubiquinone/menaquinone biosynthesis C-methylase UbiE